MQNPRSIAVTTQAISVLPPDADGSLLVPKDQPQDYRSLANSPEFTAFINKLFDHAEACSNSPAQWERRRKTVTLRKYILGYYYGIYDKAKGFVVGKSEGDGIYFDPQTPTAIESLVASLTKTKPQKKCEARAADERVDKREAAKVAEHLLQMDDDQDFTPKRQQREWKWNLLAAGETYRLTYFNTQKPGRGFDKPMFVQTEIQGGDTAKYCSLCGGTGEDESGKCLKCGNPQMDEFQVLGTTVTVNKGSEFEQVGDVDWDNPDALEITVIGETDNIAEALMVYRERMIPRCVLEDALNIHDLPDSDAPDSLSYKHLFDDPKDNSSGLKEFQKLHYQELWIAPAVLASYTFPSDTELKGGTIPGKTKGKDVFADGLYCSRVKKRICEVFPQSIGEVWCHTVNSIGEGFHGQGEWDLIELQDQATEAKSMKMNSMLLDSTQPLMVREGCIDSENFENKFGLIVPVSQSYPMEQGLSNLMGRVPAGRPPTEAYELGTEIRGEIQQREGTFSTDTSAPDIKAMGTATGVAAIQNQALGRRGPALQLYAEMEVEHAYQKLEMRQKYWCKRMYDSVAKELGGDAVKWFMECNIRQDINISVVPGSWMPRTEEAKQEGLQKFLAIAGKIVAAKGDQRLMDDILRQANDLFGAGIDIDGLETESVEARLRLEKLRDVSQFVEQQFGQFLYGPDGNIASEALILTYQYTAQLLKIVHDQTSGPDDPGAMFANLPLDVMLDTHAEFENAYSDWLKSSEGRAGSDYLRTLVRELANYHTQADAYRLMKLKQYANLTQLPDLQANLVENDAMHSQGMDHAAQVAQTQPQPAPPPPAMRVAETINYKDLPDPVKRQAEAAAGFAPAYNSVTPPQPVAMNESDKLAMQHQHDLQKMQLQKQQTTPEG